MLVDIHLPLERPLWRPKLEVPFSERDYTTAPQTMNGDLEGLLPNLGPSQIVLRQRIDQLLVSEKSITIDQVLEAFPLEFGCAELLGYFSIALRDRSHLVDPVKQNQVSFKGRQGYGKITMPAITYQRSLHFTGAVHE
jgi:hypothetical protein